MKLLFREPICVVGCKFLPSTGLWPLNLTLAGPINRELEINIHLFNFIPCFNSSYSC